MDTSSTLILSQFCVSINSSTGQVEYRARYCCCMGRCYRGNGI